MSSPSNGGDDDKNTKREPFYETVRRFSDTHLSSLLHSLIGLPSSLTPPSTSGWIIEDEVPENERPPPRPHRSGSETLAEVRKLQDNKSGQRSGGESSNDTSSGTQSAVDKCEVPNEYTFPSPVVAIREMQEMQRSLWHATELDYYRFFEEQFRGLRKDISRSAFDTTDNTLSKVAAPVELDNPRRVVSTISEMQSVTSGGVTKTRRVEIKKFADGTEERREQDRIDHL